MRLRESGGPSKLTIAAIEVLGRLMTWAKLSAIVQPVNRARRVYGFDSFEGFPDVTDSPTAG